ncbi:MAG: hypothetical protein HOV80_38435 [Polyangiaceae bacterium]|nr:hypothetical protein [Polyangiaceae bacterium]
MRVAACLMTLCIPAVSLLAAGCPDTGASYDDFAARYDKINPGTTVASGPSQCETPLGSDMEATGNWLFTLSVKLNPKKAFVLSAAVTAEMQDDGSMLVDMSLQPLSATDQTTPVCGATIEFTDLPVAPDGSFAWVLAPNETPLSLCGEANPISMSEILTGLQIAGTICGPADAPFACGTVTGIVEAPLPDFDLTGSSFTMQKALTDGSFPPPVLNCERAPADF